MRFTNLQIGRILAAFLVLVFHSTFYGEYILGVPNPLSGSAVAYWFRTTVVFLFALSGFVLTQALQRGSLRSFVGFRLLRLFPTFWAAVGLVLVVRWATGTQQPLTARGLRHLLTLWPSNPDSIALVLNVEWTLVYELFLSMAIVPLAAINRKRALGIGVGVWLMLILGKQMMAPVAEPVWLPRWAELPLSVVNIPFLLGVLLYQARQSLPAIRPAVPLIALVALAGGAALLPTTNTWSYIVQSVGAVFLVGYATTGKQIDNENPLVQAGDWAYGVYLLHVPVLVVVFTLTARYQLLAPTGSVVVFGAALALALGSAFGALEWAAYKRVRAVLTRTQRQDPSPAILQMKRAA